MKLLAPKNNWDMKSPDSWWSLLGSVQTASGMSISSDTAMRYGPANAATRVISETMASLPCSLMQRTDSRTSRMATEHNLWRIIHNVPTPEQDSMSWFDMQVGYQVICGNAYAEKQFDSVGKLIGLWPINPSRLPACNIRRNPTVPSEYSRIIAGQPGEIVYYVRNDDGTLTAIPASDMLHVPGICLQSNGIVGRGIPEFAAESLGIAMATESHTAAFFKNGAVSNMVIKSTKTVGKETAERLREQWTRMFAGVRNHYKTLILEDGMTPELFSIDPEKAQLQLARQFNATDVSRFWRVPPHLIGDLSRATFSNIEQQSLEFVTYTMLPWVVRWERAMWRQLLTDREKAEGYYFKFNLNGLLRGDSQARAQFYTQLFNMGVFSPNDIREYEDLNPVEGGDQRFVPSNNLMPLDKIGEMADAQIAKLTEPAQPPPQQQQSDVQDGDPPDNRLQELRRLQEDLIAKVELRDTVMSAHQEKAAEEILEHIASMKGDIRESLSSAVCSVSESLAESEQRITGSAQAAIDRVADKINHVNTVREERVAVREERLAPKEAGALRAVMLSAVGTATGMMKRERGEILQASKTPGTFITAHERFYKDFSAKLAEAMSFHAAALRELGYVVDEHKIASRYVADSLSLLAPLSELNCSDLESEARGVVAKWDERPEQLIQWMTSERSESCAV